MKKIIVIRKNEYVSRAQVFSFFINDKKYLIDSNSTITINTDDDEVKIYAKLLWMKSRIVVLNKNEKEFKVRIKPFLDDKFAIGSILLFIISITFMISDNDILDQIARIFLISMMAIYVYTFTIGYRHYLKLEINNAT